MRTAAGILMIIVGCTSFAILSFLVDIFGEVTNGVFIPLTLLSFGLTVGGGICGFRKKAYWWAFSGSICSTIVAFTYLITSLSTFPIPFHSGASVLGASLLGIIFIVMAMLAVIFLIKSKGEFSG